MRTLSLIFVFSLGFVAGSLMAAPAPKMRHVKQMPTTMATLSGDWMLTWAGAEYDLAMTSWGYWYCRPKGGTSTAWVGQWRLDREGKITFEESLTPERSDTFVRYTMKIDWSTGEGIVVEGAACKVKMTRSTGTIE